MDTDAGVLDVPLRGSEIDLMERINYICTVCCGTVSAVFRQTGGRRVQNPACTQTKTLVPVRFGKPSPEALKQGRHAPDDDCPLGLLEQKLHCMCFSGTAERVKHAFPLFQKHMDEHHLQQEFSLV